MLKSYNPAIIEAEVQDYWENKRSFYTRIQEEREKFYCLCMFPYPSGRLHMGHVRNYTIGDVIARYQRMLGKHVLQPMGWDAFGLPAENAAIAYNIAPAQWTYQNINYMKKQLKSLGLAIDWDCEISTCEPNYYRWNQWLFLRMFERGIVYLKEGIVNWDPVDHTVLANEQVLDGRGWRTGAIIEKRKIPMYYIAITKYAEELLEELDYLAGWPEQVKTMQKNWIGKSYGVKIGFPYNFPTDKFSNDKVLWVFTTRADTLLGVTYIAVSAIHPVASYAAKNNQQLENFIRECLQGSTTEFELATQKRKGMPTGLSVKHPITNEALPIWVANYVLDHYGEGAVMGVPAHDERDFMFAYQFNLPVKPVINTSNISTSSTSVMKWHSQYAERGICINSGKYNGLSYDQAVDAIAYDLTLKGLGEKTVSWRLRDWGISRQRYWGTPIPIIHCKQCGLVPVPEEQLPVILPNHLVPDGTGNPLAKYSEFIECLCTRCGAKARRETDTMDTFIDSSWYFLRFCSSSPNNIFDEKATKYWMPVDQYIGGIEHATMHLLYARFMVKFIRDLDIPVNYEPFTKLLTQGMVLNHIFYRKTNDYGIRYYSTEELKIKKDNQGNISAVSVDDGQSVTYGGLGTMSKSRKNGVDPQNLIEQFGADATRLFIMFAAPPEQTLEWSASGIAGSYRFLRRIWAYAISHKDEISYSSNTLSIDSLKEPLMIQLWLEINTILLQAVEDFRRHQFNTVISAGMKILNLLTKLSSNTVECNTVRREGMSILLRLMAPIIPHITHYLWHQLEYGNNLLDAQWPQPDITTLKISLETIVVQVNGKKRGLIKIPKDSSVQDIKSITQSLPNVQNFIQNKLIKKIIVVPGKLVNIVC